MNKWMGDPDDVLLLWVAALSDCRPVFVDEDLCNELKWSLVESLQRQPGFLRALARESLATSLPLRKFPSLRLRGSGSGRGATLNVKRQGSQLITNAARLSCLDAGWLEQSNTGARLSYLAEHKPDLRATMLEVMVAADLFTNLRLKWHVEQFDRNEMSGDTRKCFSVPTRWWRKSLSNPQSLWHIRLIFDMPLRAD